MYLCVPIPFAALGKTEVFLAARLACLIHAANVHSEPGSNPSILFILDLFESRIQRSFRSIVGELPVKEVRNLKMNRNFYWLQRLKSFDLNGSSSP